MEANSKEVIYYSLDSYKSNYSNNLKLFLDKFNEANEYDFVSREINDYKNYLLITDYIDKNYGDIIISYQQADDSIKGYYATPKEFQILSEEKRAFGFFSQIVNKINESQLSTNDAIFKQKLNFNKIVSFLEFKESELPINSISENDKLKVVYIDKIKAAEELAKTTLEISLKQDFFDIESKKVNDKTHKELLKIYYSNIISNYLNIRNLYKASNEQFHFLNNEAENQLTEDDRIDFIATVLCGYLLEGNQEDSNIDEVDLLEIFNQLKNIDELIYETKLAELKYNAIKKLIEKFESDKTNPIITYPLVEDSWEINEELIENIKLQYSTSKLLFGCKEDDFEIIPKIKTHDYLYSNFNIDENILRFYYSPTRMFITDNDFEKMTSSGYIGNIDRTLKPYPIKIFGAYHFRNKLHTQLSFILFEKKYFINNKKIKYLSDLVPYYMDYSYGFKKGFNDFEKECITPFLNDFSDKSDFTFKIFEYVTKNIAFQQSWFNNGGSFYVTPNESKENHITNAFEDGEKQGYYYKAWSIIFGDSKIYAAYFKEYYSEINNNDSSESMDNFKYLENKYPLTKHASNKAKIVLNEILIKKASLVDVIDCIDNNSNSETKRLLVDDLISTYRIISNEFMFKVKEADIIEALENNNNLEYVFIGKGDYSKIKAFVREIKGFTTVYNVDGLPTVGFENSIKLVLLNNLMIDYFDGFFANEIEGFENISHYKYINKYLLEKYREPINSVPIIEVNTQETKTIKETKPRKFPAKYHALTYILELLTENKKPPHNPDGDFKKDEIIKIGKERCNDTGQNFYNFVKDHYALVSSKNIKYSVYKNNWKEIILDITNYRKEIEIYIENNNL